ncbi:hypothetical protein OQJ13_01915 [Legionella sp. PATHC035]|uniref:hypothetical protein n=1 Tax=Legionella sp. PATHC035 TaxID=2992040 RepID=UPI002244B13E|nr:hypothetical protein [Legionella sp. PATHC035]MCW8407731.1 hypothetical protein [Legionella sp. PATHC035]
MTTHDTEYWPISTTDLMAKFSNETLFENDNLTTKFLSLQVVIENLDFNPTLIEAQKFIKEMSQDDTELFSHSVTHPGKKMVNRNRFFIHTNPPTSPSTLVTPAGLVPPQALAQLQDRINEWLYEDHDLHGCNLSL